MRAVISVIGKDNFGILALISGLCAQNNVNVVDVSQTVMQDMFCMIMLVDTARSTLPFKDFAETLENAGKERNLVVHTMHEDIFNAMHRI